MDDLERLERAVLSKTFDGAHPALAILREQWAQATIVKRELTGVGAYSTFRVASSAPRLPLAKAAFGDVIVQTPTVRQGIGTVLFIRDGWLDFLEMFTYDEPWPQTLGELTLSYERVPRNLTALDYR